MRQLVSIAKALANRHRIRILMALTGGELCVCQIIALLELAPSSISNHLSLLTHATLLESRKEGRWIYYRLSKESSIAKGAIKWIKTSLKESDEMIEDQEKLKEILKMSLEEVCAK